MKKLLLFLMIGLFLISFTSAIAFNDVKEYNATTKTVIIKDSVLGDVKSTVQLNTPLSNVVGVGYVKVAEFEISNYDRKDYLNVLKALDFYDLKNNNKRLTRDFDYKYKVNYLINEPTYNYTYTTLKNSTVLETQTQNGTIKVIQEGWEKLTPADIKKNQYLTVGIFTTTHEGDYIEWIPTFSLDKDYIITEWANFSASVKVNLTAYYKLDEQYTSGTGTIIDATNYINASNGGADNSTGKIQTSYNFVQASSDKITLDKTKLVDGWSAITVNLWANPDQLTGDVIAFGQDAVIRLGYINPSGFWEGFIDHPGRTTSLGTAKAAIGRWDMLTLTWNGTHQILYVNGTVYDTDITTGNLQTNANTLSIGRWGSLSFDGNVDEVGIWNRSLTPTEITDLWNSGAGLPYDGNPAPSDNPPVVTLQTPANNTNYSTNSVTAYAVVYDDINLTNVTFYLNNVPQSTNTSGFNNSNYSYTYGSLSDGYYIWNVGGTDNSSQSTNGTQRVFTVDTTLPVITANISTATQVVDSGQNVTVNFGVVDSHKAICWYQYNGVNVTFSCTTTQFNVTAVNPQSTITLFANDTFGNLATPVVLTFSYNTYGLMSEYHMEQTTGVMVDSLGNNNGTVGGGVTRGVQGYLLLGYNFSYATNSFVNLTQTFPKRNNQTLGFWYNPYLQNGSGQLFDYHSTGFKGWTIDRNGGGIRLLHYDGVSSSTSCTIAAGNLTVGGWNYLTFSWNVTGIQGYVNGVQQCGSTGTLSTNQIDSMYFGSDGVAPGLTAKMDEVRYYNISLNSTQILALYNNYNFPLIVLNSPENDTSVLPGTTTFNWTSASNEGLANTTLWINNILNETIMITGISNTTTTSKTLTLGTHTWFVESCSINLCINSSIRTINVNTIIIINQTYNNNTVETSIEPFTMTMDYNSSSWISNSAYLVYNGTEYSATQVGGGDVIRNDRNISIPSVNTTTNVTFYWSLRLTNSTGTFIYNTTSFNQSISLVDFELCNYSDNTQLFFSIISTTNISLPVNASFSSTWRISTVANSAVVLNRTYQDLSETKNTFGFCISPTSSDYTISVDINVAATGYTDTDYYIVNSNYSTPGDNITIYLLEDNSSTLTEIQVVDENYNPIPNAYVTIQRYDIGTDTYYNVAMARTSYLGKDLFYAEWYNTWYKYIVVVNDEVVGTFGPVKISESPQVLPIDSGITNPYDKFEDFLYSLTYNNATQNFVLTFIKPSGLVDEACLRVTKRNVTNDYAICDVCETSNSATVYCNIASAGNGTFIADFYATGSFKWIDSLIKTIGGQNALYELIGNDNGTGLAIITAGIVVSFFLINPALGILGMLLGMMANFALGFQPFDILAFLGICVMGGLVIWAVKK